MKRPFPFLYWNCFLNVTTLGLVFSGLLTYIINFYFTGQITRALQCTEFYFLRHTSKMNTSFSPCAYSFLLTRTPHLMTLLLLSSNEGDNYGKEIKVTLGRTVASEWRENCVLRLLFHSSTCTLGLKLCGRLNIWMFLRPSTVLSTGDITVSQAQPAWRCNTKQNNT